MREIVKQALCGAALLFFAACEEEALMHPPSPPEATLAELQAASRPSSLPNTPPPPPPKIMTMAAFMHDEVEPEARKALASKKPDPALDRMLHLLATLAPDDPKFALPPTRSWQAVTENSLKPGRYAQGCRQCHVSYLRYYKKKFTDRTFAVPEAPY